MYKIGRQVEIADRTAERTILSLIGPASGRLAGGVAAGARPPREHAWSCAVGDCGRSPPPTSGSTCCRAGRRPTALRGALLERGRATRSARRPPRSLRIEHGLPAPRRRHERREPARRGRASWSAPSASRRAATSARSRSPACTTAATRTGTCAACGCRRRSRPGRPVDGRRQGGRPRSPRAACLPRLGPIALAILRREVEPGDEVVVGDGADGATVVELPFDDRSSPRRLARHGRSDRIPRVEARRATQSERRRTLSAESPLLGRPAPGRGRRRGAARPGGRPTTQTPTSTACPAPRPRRAAAAARADRADRAARPRAPGRRLGPLGARVPADGAGPQLLLPLLVPGRGRGHRARPDGRRRAARVQPLRRAAAGRADDHAGDPQRAPEPAPALHARRALVQGLSRRRDARQQDRAGRRAPGERPPAAARRGPARARVPGGPEGDAQALLAALQAAPLRPRRIRQDGDPRRASRSCRWP